MAQQGLYEQLINKLILSKLKDLDKNFFYTKETHIDKNEAARVITQYLANVIRLALSLFQVKIVSKNKSSSQTKSFCCKEGIKLKISTKT